MSLEPKTPLSTERIRNLYSWAYAWRSEDHLEGGDADLSRLRETNRVEFDSWLAEHDRTVADAVLSAAEDHIIGEDDHEWARNARGSSISYPTVMEALDATREDFEVSS